LENLQVVPAAWATTTATNSKLQLVKWKELSNSSNLKITVLLWATNLLTSGFKKITKSLGIHYLKACLTSRTLIKSGVDHHEASR